MAERVSKPACEADRLELCHYKTIGSLLCQPASDAQQHSKAAFSEPADSANVGKHTGHEGALGHTGRKAPEQIQGSSRLIVGLYKSHGVRHARLSREFWAVDDVTPVQDDNIT